MKFSNEEIAGRLKKAGLRATPQRIQLLKLLFETNKHPTAEMLIKMAKEEDNPMSMSVGTVYNALDSFEKAGLIRRVHDNSEVMRYDANTSFHIHLINEDTNEIEDIYDNDLEEIIKKRLKADLRADQDIDMIDVTLYKHKSSDYLFEDRHLG